MDTSSVGGSQLVSDIANITANWNWEDQHVTQSFVSPSGGSTQQQKQGIAVNDIIESGTVLIAAGPADLDAVTAFQGGPTAHGQSDIGFRLVPIGLVETAQISMNKPLSRIFEIGSKLSYIIPGRTVGGISLSRVFFDGPSLLKVLYYGEVKADYATAQNKYAQFFSNPRIGADGKTEMFVKTANIGSGDLAMNLASTFFDQPVGLAFFFKDRKSNTVGQTYFEGCSVSSYNLGISANMNVLTESVNIEFVRCRPILTNATSNGGLDQITDVNIVSPSDTTAPDPSEGFVN